MGKRIREWRTRGEITQEDLSFCTGLSIPYLSEIENGKRRPSVDSIVAIADALGITVDELLSGNLQSSINDYQTDIDFLLYDCSKEERYFIYEMLKAIKTSLRQSKWNKNNKNDG